MNKMRYTFFRALNPEWELAACWQSILKFRGIHEPSQSEIADILKIGKDGFPRESADGIVRKTGIVSLTHVNPFLINGEAEDILDAVKEKDTDVIVAYNGEKLNNVGKRYSFALWNSYNSKTDEVKLQTPNSKEPLTVSLGMRGKKSGLMDCMRAREDERYGLHIVKAWK